MSVVRIPPTLRAEVNGERRDSLDPDAFRYKMTAREIAG